jgi:hypothetical protein
MIRQLPEPSLGPVLRVSEPGPDVTSPRPLLPVPHSNTGFTELRTVYIHKPLGFGWTLGVDDEPLQDADEPLVRAWTWTPGFYAGEVTAELEAPDGRAVGTYLLDVSPDPNKLGRELFAQMVREIWGEDPTLVLGSEPAQTLIGDLGRADDPLVAFARLRRYGPAVLRALHAISSHPIQTIRQTRQLIPLHRARRADRQTVLEALRDRTGLRILAGRDDEVRTDAAESRVQLDVPVSVSHFDGAANRCVTALALAVDRRIRDVTRSLARLCRAHEPSDTRTALAPRWPARERFLTWLAQQLKETLARSPYSAVTRPEVTAAGLNAAAAHPLYSRAHGLAWRVLRTGVSGTQADERLWVSPTWEIYERWCFVRLGAMLRATRPDLRWERLHEHPSGARAAWQGRGENAILELLLQPVFTAWDQGLTRGWRSLSGQLIPDLVVTRDSPAVRFLVLDAKYRVHRPAVLDAMRSAHLYHDALRIDHAPPERSLLLLPASGGAQWLEQTQFHEEHGVGVAVLGAGTTSEANPLLDLIRRL